MVFILLLLGTISFAALMSMFDGNESNQISLFITKNVYRLLTAISNVVTSHSEGEMIQILNYLLRNLAHVFMFFAIYIALVLGARTIWRNKFGIMTCSYIITFVLACLNEVQQMYVAGRTADFEDVIIDMIGSTLGVFFIIACLIFRKICRVLAKGWKPPTS